MNMFSGDFFDNFESNAKAGPQIGGVSEFVKDLWSGLHLPDSTTKPSLTDSMLPINAPPLLTKIEQSLLPTFEIEDDGFLNDLVRRPIKDINNIFKKAIGNDNGSKTKDAQDEHPDRPRANREVTESEQMAKYVADRITPHGSLGENPQERAEIETVLKKLAEQGPEAFKEFLKELKEQLASRGLDVSGSAFTAEIPCSYAGPNDAYYRPTNHPMRAATISISNGNREVDTMTTVLQEPPKDWVVMPKQGHIYEFPNVKLDGKETNK